MDDTSLNANSEFRNLIESLRIPTILLDAHLKVCTYTTDAAASILARVPEPVGKPLADLNLSVSGEQLVADAKAVLRTRTPVLRNVSGHDGRYYEVRLLPRMNADGGAVGVAIAFSDITDHKQADEDARLFAAIVRSSNDAVVVSNLEGRILTWNPGAERLYGFTQSEAAALDIGKFIVPESGQEERLRVRKRLCRGEAVEPYEAKRLTRDGRTIDVVVNPLAILDGKGKVVALAAIVRDISESKRAEEKLRAAYAEIGLQFEERGTQLSQAIETINAELSNRARVEEALRESQERIRAILNTAAEGIISINRHGVIDTFNLAAERLFGYSAEEVIGKNVSLLMPEPERDKHAGYLTNYLTTGVKKVIGIGREVEGRRKDGTFFPMDLAVGEGADGDGPVFVGILRDLTARKQSENMLRTAERLASIGTLAAGLGHDMNNVLLPVRARLNALHAAAEAGKLRPTERRHTAAITHSVAYLQQLADGLHYLAMDPEATDAHISTDLHRWWRQAGALLSKSVAKNIEFSASIPPRLPAVGVAPHQLTQAVLNLLVNASESITSAGVRRQGRIKVWAKAAHDESAGPCVKLCVTDNGKGMSEDVRRRAFDMFFTTKPRGLGTGLGLPLVRKVVTSVGGSVQIESKEGKNATITLVLPAKARRPRSGVRKQRARAALISLDDGRAVALVQQMLIAGGVSAMIGDKPGKYDVWVCEPTAERLKTAASWKAGFPRRRLVLFGEADALSRAKWAKLNPIVIHNRYDFSEVRSALSLAGSGR